MSRIHAGGRNAEEAIDLVDGQATESENDSGLDIVGETRKDLNLEDSVQNLSGSISSHTEDGHSPGRKRSWTRMRDVPMTGQQIQWSDDDDFPATPKPKKQKQSAKPRARSRKENLSGIVGKRTKGRRTNKSKAFKLKDPLDSDSDEELMDEKLPDYLKNRRAKFDKIRERLGEAGLKLPPRYEEIDFSDDERMAELEERPALKHLKPCAPYEDILIETTAGIIPASIAQWLRDYQVEGARFLHEKFVYQQGGILGDDMGLGKTIQVIAFLTAAFGKTGDERDQKRMRKLRRAAEDHWYPRVLIVCPKSLMMNWHAELDRWGWWQVYICHGSPQIRNDALQAAESGRLEIMLTTYDTYKRHMNAMNTMEWDCVIADECHIIKGSTSEVTKAMNDVNAMCRIGLTGTAIQNNYEELWTLLNWANPGQLGDRKSWKDCISGPLQLGQSYDSTHQQLATARRTAKTLVEKLLPRYFIRRMKSLIADQLPAKKDRVVFCPLTEIQAEAYENLTESEVIQHIARAFEPCECSSGKKFGWCCGTNLEDGTSWKTQVFPSIMNLQKLANHLALLIPSAADSSEKQSKQREVLEAAVPDGWKELWRNRDSLEHYANVKFCGKWQIMKSLLRYWHDHPTATGRNKVLVFSHSVKLLLILKKLFTTTDYNVSYLDGSISKPEERQAIVDNFNRDENEFVFLISTKSGGVGLNITAANKVIVVDPHWNPSYDLQAQDRAYRIGQLRDVEVFRLVSAGTIEEIVYARQVYKQQQANIGYNASLERRYFRGVQDNKDKKGELFGLVNLFRYQADQVVLREIVRNSNVAESKAGVLVSDMSTQELEDLDKEDVQEDELLKLDDDETEKAMSKLADLITGEDDDKKWRKKRGQKKTKNAVEAILSKAGVSYSHENSEVIGTSKVESKLSRQALEREHDLDTMDNPVFVASQSQMAGVSGDEDASDVRRVHWKHRPPPDVRQRHFCSMAKQFGFDDVTEFALVVEGWTQEQRRRCLDKFYQARREGLLRKVATCDEDDETEEEL